ncbi:hypothetical protein RHGRI_014457 [Rhododendron griersonianum]|uniref:AT-hook motif nuclear-localized protein n=1 Tax=Rhododendron griersonianum TaxID=479676 RepID=A0AAV6K9F6_9ERIC|nr:hypothetical protein RHGRI_014457 [Rhododendron griersonianum]
MRLKTNKTNSPPPFVSRSRPSVASTTSSVGTVRFLFSSRVSTATGVTTAFTAVQVRSPSGQFQGVLNIAATVLNGLEFGAIALGSSSTICFARSRGQESPAPEEGVGEERVLEVLMTRTLF